MTTFLASLAWWVAAIQMMRILWRVAQQRRMTVATTQVDSDLGVHLETVSVIIPARNEAVNMLPCLDAARTQLLPAHEIIVVDDSSEDGTADLVRAVEYVDPHVRLVEGTALPMGWTGKCWALHQGAQLATGSWLLFVDADTRLRPCALVSAVSTAFRRGTAFLSAATEQELQGIGGCIVQGAVLGFLAEVAAPTLVNNPKLPHIATANGQFLLIHREAYDKLGGHAAVRGEIAEDVFLAVRAKKLGVHYEFIDGRALATTRMYRSLGALWQGWTKNFHAGFEMEPALTTLGLVIFIVCIVTPYALMYWACTLRSRSFTGASIALFALGCANRRIADRWLGIPGLYALSDPIGQIAVLLLIMGARWKALRGNGVSWRGRRYDVSMLADGRNRMDGATRTPRRSASR
jgi:cellulose synthase/poly-beta-1,6-N-acetylglucosamine synthase-like glycosyltransferase